MAKTDVLIYQDADGRAPLLDWLLRPDPKNEWQACNGCRLWLVGKSSYLVANYDRYRFLWQSIRQAEYKKNWDR